MDVLRFIGKGNRRRHKRKQTINNFSYNSRRKPPKIYYGQETPLEELYRKQQEQKRIDKKIRIAEHNEPIITQLIRKAQNKDILQRTPEERQQDRNESLKQIIGKIKTRKNISPETIDRIYNKNQQRNIKNGLTIRPNKTEEIIIKNSIRKDINQMGLKDAEEIWTTDRLQREQDELETELERIRNNRKTKDKRKKHQEIKEILKRARNKTKELNKSNKETFKTIALSEEIESRNKDSEEIKETARKIREDAKKVIESNKELIARNKDIEEETKKYFETEKKLKEQERRYKKLQKEREKVDEVNEYHNNREMNLVEGLDPTGNEEKDIEIIQTNKNKEWKDHKEIQAIINREETARKLNQQGMTIESDAMSDIADADWEHMKEGKNYEQIIELEKTKEKLEKQNKKE